MELVDRQGERERQRESLSSMMMVKAMDLNKYVKLHILSDLSPTDHLYR